MEVHASYGGLLMLLKVCAAAVLNLRGTPALIVFACGRTSLPAPQGEPAALKDLDVDMRIYLLARKI